MVPVGTVSEVGGIHVMVVMIALAECDERDEPAIPAGVGGAVRLPSPQMADGVDAERRIQHGECAAQTGEEKAAYSAHEAVMEKADEERAC